MGIFVKIFHDSSLRYVGFEQSNERSLYAYLFAITANNKK
ncbi:hypothetical protein J2S13_000523 [Oikeobacillus pervagus]|uniref:Uncharacterized protein n=1 Tax=Oikeobacillus pervagus TaxID=1325931 RepID=A0AAJ1WFM9_9BACI|nr:hypothetical protein [Oikeobacillus pervagus]